MGFGRVGRRARGICVALPVACALGVPAAANAATLTVTSTEDNLTANDGQCTLREAIAAVNSFGTSTDCGTADSSGNTIVLGPHAYTLSIGPNPTDDNTTGDLDLTANIPTTIEGAGVDQTSISGAGFPTNNPDRLFHVIAGNVTMQDLTLTRGTGPNGADGALGLGSASATAGGTGFNGGAVFNGATLKLSDVAVTDNAAGNGGRGGEDIDSTSSANGGAGGMAGVGGGIANFGTLDLEQVTVTGNTAGSGGAGGQAGNDGISGGTGGDGGCCGDGGGVYTGGGGVVIANSTITQNHAGNGGAGGTGGNGSTGGLNGKGGSGAGGGSGGGVAVTDGSLKVIDSTITANVSGAGGNGGMGGGEALTGGNGGNAGNAARAEASSSGAARARRFGAC